MHKLYAASSLQEAYLIAGMLATAGIDAQILNQHSQGGLGEIPFGEVYPEIWLADDANMAAARRIIDAYEQPAADPGTVVCWSCHEENPADFDVCWHCGKAL